MLQYIKRISYVVLFLLVFGAVFSVPVSYAASSGIADLQKATLPSSPGGGFLDRLFHLLFDQILGPILNIFTNGGSQSASPGIIKPLPPKNSGSIQDNGILRGKVIVLDPGHGGNNPGAVSNGVQEADINLAVGLLLRDKLQQEGAKVIMTRQTNRSVANQNSTLSQELQARVDLAEQNRADLFISIHSNSNPDQNIAGAMTFYPQDKSSQLALEVQRALVQETSAIDKGTSPATFYVLRNTSMPSILVEMGFVTNPQEAVKLKNNSYQSQLAQGIFNGVVHYLQSR